MLSEHHNEAEEAEEGQREEERRVEETEAGDTVAEPMEAEPREEVNEGITTLMAACQQGLEHDVRSILRR